MPSYRRIVKVKDGKNHWRKAKLIDWWDHLNERYFRVVMLYPTKKGLEKWLQRHWSVVWPGREYVLPHSQVIDPKHPRP